MMDKKLLHRERMKLWDASIASHKQWLDMETGLFSLQYMEERSCPVCNLVSHNPVFNKSGGTYAKCTNCDMVYINPVIKDEYLETYYRNNHSVQSEIVESDQSFYRDIYLKGLEMVLDYKAVGNVLDIGCSAGGFLNLAKEKGLKTYGIELNQSEVEVAQKEHTIFSCYLNEINKKFDLITMWDVFEHIKNGKEMLEQVREHLTEDGCLFLQIPTPDSLAAKILQKDCNMFDGLEHVNLYPIKSLMLLLESVGMEIACFDTVISEEKVISNYLNYEDPYLGSFNNDPIFTESFILQHGMGYKIQAVIKLKR